MRDRACARDGAVAEGARGVCEGLGDVAAPLHPAVDATHQAQPLEPGRGRDGVGDRDRERVRVRARARARVRARARARVRARVRVSPRACRAPRRAAGAR